MPQLPVHETGSYSNWLTEQSIGHCDGWTHLLLVSSMSCPGGQPHPFWHCCVHTRPGLVQVAGQVLHPWTTCPCIGHCNTEASDTRDIIHHILYCNSHSLESSLISAKLLDASITSRITAPFILVYTILVDATFFYSIQVDEVMWLLFMMHSLFDLYCVGVSIIYNAIIVV